MPVFSKSFVIQQNHKNMEATVVRSKKEQKVKEIQQTKISPVINVSADRLWEIIGPGFGEAHTWSRAVDHSVTSGIPTIEGASCSNRACDLNASGFNKISETIIEYNDEKRKLGYTVDTGLPGFVVYLANNWSVIDVAPNQSQARMNIQMKMKPFMGALMGGMFKKNLNKACPQRMDTGKNRKSYIGDVHVE